MSKSLLIASHIRHQNGQAGDFFHSGELKSFQIAHSCLAAGYEVYFINRDEQAVHRLQQIFPVFKYKTQPFEPARFDLLITLCDNIDDVQTLLKLGFDARLRILSIPAVHWFENDDLFATHTLVKYIDFIRNEVDCIVTSNTRMAGYMRHYWKHVAGWNFPERLFSVPVAVIPEEVSAKRTEKDAEAKIAQLKSGAPVRIINAGGTWSWTDFNSFATAFGRALEAGHTSLHLDIPGLSQPTNFDQSNIAYIQETKAILSRIQERFAGNVTLNQWSPYADVLQRTRSAHIGLNVNKDTIENLFSHRVRAIEYIKSATPMICTYGDELTDQLDKADLCWPHYPGDIDGYQKTLIAIGRDRANLADRIRAFANLQLPDPLRLQNASELLIGIKYRIQPGLHAQVRIDCPRLDSAPKEAIACSTSRP